jgi:hypothetical protein
VVVRISQFIIPILSWIGGASTICLLWLVGCAGLPISRVAILVSDTAAPLTTRADAVVTYDDLIQAWQASATTVEATGLVHQPFFSVVG